MKKLLFIILIQLGFLTILLYQGKLSADMYNCYSCTSGEFVCYSGDDSDAKKSKAKQNYNCDVRGLSRCDDFQCQGKFVN